MAKLYELAQSYQQLAAQLEEYDLDAPTLLDTLESSNELMSIEEKAGNIVRMVKNIEADIPSLESEIKRLTDKKKAIENRAKSIKTYLQGCMEAAGLEKIKVDTFTVALQNGKESVSIIEQSAIPKKFFKTKIEQSIDKLAIYETLKAGKEVAGCKLEPSKSLRIR